MPLSLPASRVFFIFPQKPVRGCLPVIFTVIFPVRDEPVFIAYCFRPQGLAVSPAQTGRIYSFGLALRALHGWPLAGGVIRAPSVYIRA